MDSIVSFGGVAVYIFDQDEQTHISDNFRDLVTRTKRMVGVSGGFDELGLGAAPRSIGNARFEGWLQAETRAQMSENLRLLGLMSSGDVGALVMQPMDTSLPELYCVARVNTISYAQSAVRLPRQQIKVIANFNVANPGWRRQGTAGPVWGGGISWGNGSKWGGTFTETAVSGLSNDISIDPGGNAFLYPQIYFSCGGGETATDIRIQRIMGNVLDQIRYIGTLTAGDELIVDTTRRRVQLNLADAYDSNFSVITPAWFRLQGGTTNTIRVLLLNPADAGTVSFRYEEVFV